MSDTAFIAFFIVASFAIGFFSGAITGEYTGRFSERERFLTFCTDQNIPYAKCKEEWERP
jgi:hypothetical protein